jgi:hypothetical protein
MLVHRGATDRHGEMVLVTHYPHCHRRLIETDLYGERLIGYVDCNRWGRPEDDTPPMQLLEYELAALRARRRR